MSSEEREKFEEFEAEGSKLTGRDKYIYPLHAYRRTRARFAVFDTETRTIKSEKVLSKTKRAAERLELRYIYLRLHDSSDNYVKPMAFDFNTEMDAPDREQKRWFTKKLVQLARTNSYLTIWAHNAMFDVSAAIDFDWLSRGTQTHRFEYTFVSTHPFIFKIKGQAREKGSKPFLLRFLDTYSFYKYSLETLAPYFGLSKVPIDFEKLEKSGDEADPELLAMRCKTDVDITEAIVTDLYGRMRGKVAVSAPQMAFNTFRTMLSKPIEKLGGLSIDSYHGGRTEIFKRMVQPRSMRLDINSMYPFAMCKPLPVSHGMHVENPSLDYLLDECKSGRYVASIRAIVKVPPKYIGPFPYWNGTRLLFPTGEFETTINSPELLAVDSWKYVERVLEADFFRAEPFLENYSRKFYAAKLEASRNKDRIGREYNKLLLNCFSPDTDVITPTGIKRITDFKVGDKVISMDERTMRAETDEVIKVHKYRYKGEMFDFKSRDFDLSVTPNHNFLVVHQSDRTKLRFLEAKDVVKDQYYIPPFKENKERDDTQKYISTPSYKFDVKDAAELCGWFVSEGHVSLLKENWKFVITQKSGDTENHDDEIERIEKLLTKMKIKYVYRSGTFQVYSKELALWLKELCYISKICNSATKKVPDFIMEGDVETIKRFWKALYSGDGDKTNPRYTTTSETLAKQCCVILARLGYNKIKCYIDEHITYPHAKTCWRVVFHNGYIGIRARSDRRLVTKTQYNGFVWCITLKKNRTIIAGRNNRFILCGRSLFGKFGQKHKETVPVPEKMLAELPPEHVWTGVEDIELAADYPDFGLSAGDVVHAVFVAGQPVFSREVDYNISPAVASFITSWARSRLYELMETRASENLIYVDTDSLVIPESIEHRFRDVIGDEMGKLKIEFRGTFIGFAPKVYIFNGTDDEGKKKLEVKSKGVPRDLFLKAIKNGEKTVTFNHILGFHERLRGYNTVSLLRSDITRSLSLTDSKRRWLGDNTSMPIEMTMT